MIRRLVALVLSVLLVLSAVPLAIGETITAEEAVNRTFNILMNDYGDTIITDYHARYNEKRIMLYVQKNGLGSTLQFASDSGWDETYPVWVEYKQNILDLYKDIIEMLEANGRTDLDLEIWVENDMKGSGERCRWGNYLMCAGDSGWIDDMALGRDPFFQERDRQDVSTLPSDIQPIHNDLSLFLSENTGFDFVDIFYNEEYKRLLIDVAVSGIGESLYTAKETNDVQVYSQWGEFKATMDILYEAIVAALAEQGFQDIEVYFSLVNDELYIRDYWDRMYFDPLYEIMPDIIFGERFTEDIMD